MTFDLPCPRCYQIVAVPGDTMLVPELPLPGHDCPAPAANVPGSTAEQLPDHLLALIDPPRYTSTACDLAVRLGDVIWRNPSRRDELYAAVNQLHARCRINNKFTGQLCDCPHHDMIEEPA